MKLVFIYSIRGDEVMKFCWVTINVSNMEESIKFYKDLIGLEILDRFTPYEGVEIVMLGEENGTMVELISNQTTKLKSKGISIGFKVDSLEESIENMKNNGVKILTEPVSPSPNLEFYFVEDPNGLEIQLIKMK